VLQHSDVTQEKINTQAQMLYFHLENDIVIILSPLVLCCELYSIMYFILKIVFFHFRIATW